MFLGNQYGDPSAYGWFFTEHIAQSMRSNIEIRRNYFCDDRILYLFL